MKKIEVCLSPDLLHLFDLKGKIVVVVDILRATSCMVTGLANGINSIIPVATLEECRKLQSEGCICAAERDGMKVNGFELDNSPFSYMNEELKGKCIAVTTTNGTQAIVKSNHAEEILIGAFLNIKAISDYLKEKSNDVLIVCSGWKGNFNIEDTLFAGNLHYLISSGYNDSQDAMIMAAELYVNHKGNLLSLVNRSQHAQRLNRLNIVKDIEFCLTKNVYDVLPLYKDGKIENIHALINS